MADNRLRESDETNWEQRKLGEEQGAAFIKALRHMVEHEADDGAMIDLGDVTIACAVEEAEGMYVREGDDLVWREPGRENCHVEVTVLDDMTGRFVPGLNVTVTLMDAEGEEIGSGVQPYLWHPWLYHYGRNWEVPEEGEITVKVHIDMPDFMRHDRENGKFLDHPIDVEFKGIHVEPGRK